MAKAPSSAEQELRTVRKILKLLEREHASRQRRIVEFVSSALQDAEQDEKREAVMREGTFPRAVQR